ncbi:MAG: hypothetical protein JSW41_02030 [Candidatus Aenigmatarchaeota archaeon]|nr:MAG: hypothetical protein JSW41_02030 [Candidatus Aenigmarchaeota archaeon]
MDRTQVLIKKYEVLVSEWNKVSMVISIYFSACIIGLVIGLVFYNMVAVSAMLLIMAVFAGFEYKARTQYVETKAEIEKEIFAAAKTKPLQVKEIIRKGFTW